jgi:hypothetical protein
VIFSFLLWFAAWRIRLKLFFVTRKNPSLLDEFIDGDTSIQVQTKDKKSLRCFVLQKSTKKRISFHSFAKELEQPSLTVIFPDGNTAREIISALRKDKSQIFNFIQEQKLTMEGDFSILQKLFAIKEKMEASSIQKSNSNLDNK